MEWKDIILLAFCLKISPIKTKSEVKESFTTIIISIPEVKIDTFSQEIENKIK